MSRSRHVIEVVLFLLWMGCADPLAANGIIRDSLGAISSGRGGANVAHDDNLSILNDNPAGMSWLEQGLRLELSSDFLSPVVDYSDPMDSDRSRETFFVLPQFALAYRRPEWPVSFGISAYLPGGYGAEYKLRHGTFGRQTYESSGLLLKVQPTVAVQLCESLSIGAGLGVGYSQAHFKMPYTFQSGAFAGQSALVDLDSDGVGITGNIGVQFRPTERLTIGAAFISEAFVEQEGDFDLDVRGSPLAALVSDPTASYDVEHSLRWPRSAAAGASYRFDCGRLSGDVVWYNWANAFDDLRFTLTDGDNPEFDALAGNRVQDTFPLEWRDSVSVRLGYELFLSENTTLRTGYIYNLNPIPRDTLVPILPGTLEHSFSVGVGHQVSFFEVHLAYQYAFGSRQEVGQSQVMGGDFDSSAIRAQAHWLFLTVAVKF